MSTTRRVTIAASVLVAISSLALAHDMFLKPAQFFLAEHSALDLALLNGTFSKSENSIERKRLLDISVLGPAGRFRVDTSQWMATGDTSFLRVKTGAAGTWVLGVSTKPNIIALTADEFNTYLKDDGIPDVLAARRSSGELGKDARERYHKHVKAMVQVGESRSEHFATALGYPAEILPVSNPYALKPGGTLRFKTLVDGKPAANQYVLYGGRTASGGRIEMRHVRSGADGSAEIRVAVAGTWYIKFINMTKLSGDSEADYESKWATLTFAVR
jgi:uncharacterized GH25 family protein